MELVPGTQEAQRYISERACDLALLDLALPRAVGVEVLRNIRTKKPELPQVFFTASANARAVGPPLIRTVGGTGYPIGTNE